LIGIATASRKLYKELEMHQLGGNQDSTKFSELLEMMVYPCPLVLQQFRRRLTRCRFLLRGLRFQVSDSESKSESFFSSLSS
jgi:hypothetical protein